MSLILKRFEDWPRRLSEAIEAARRERFAWGEHDCALFMADCVLAMTGTDPAEEFRGRYSSLREVDRLIGEAGGLPAMAERAFGQAVPPQRAQRGDVVMKEEGAGRFAFGVCAGEFAAFASFEGIVFVGLDQCLAAWRV